MKNRPVMLLVMDGYGLAKPGRGNAISAARTPNLDALNENCPHAELNASGRFVGLPEGQMGNSEVGHTNIGAGRVVWQELSRISNAIKDGSFFKNEELVGAMEYAGKGHPLHLMGLLSDGGVHSHMDHLYALLEMAAKYGLKDVYIHCILDGRDVPPSCAEQYINDLENKCAQLGVGEIATVTGRYYAMDRDKRWDRVCKAYDNYTLGTGRRAESAAQLLKEARENGETDEFVLPGIVCYCPDCVGNMDAGCSYKKHLIREQDAVIFFNFRPDRAREITRCLTELAFDGFERKVFPGELRYVCFTQYFPKTDYRVAFAPQSLANTLGEYVSAQGLKQLRIAETEKYAHVTFFFNGGVEAPYEGEERILVDSPKVATYDLKPEMSAFEVTDKVVESIGSGKYDLIIMNLANCDMVGHTGVFDAAVKAVEAVDSCVGKIVQAIRDAGGTLLITADHGNADEMLDADGNIVTSHSTNPVPVILVGPENVKDRKTGENKTAGCSLADGSLCDLAPTLLELMGLPVPDEMTGKSLLV